MRLARLLTLILALAINVLTLAGCGGGGGGNAAPGGGDTAAPTVSITAPASGTMVTGVTTITATAVDNVGVSRVDFYANGVQLPLGTDTAEPYSYSWNTQVLTHGSYILLAKAYDTAGNMGQSSSVSVTVPFTISMSTVPGAGNTAVGTVVLYGAAASEVYGIDVRVASVPAGATVTAVTQTGVAAGAFQPAFGEIISLASLNGFGSGEVMQISFANVPAGASFTTTLNAVYGVGGVQIQ